MEHVAAAAPVLPLRPLTVGELLDSAVVLLRAHARALLPVGLVMAALEQSVLVPLRALADIEGWDPFDYLDRFGAFWLVLCLGAAIEVVIIALLGGLTARAAAAAVLGQRLPVKQLLDPRGDRPAVPVVVVVAALAGVVVLAAALLGPLWAVGYAFVGLAVPADVLDRIGPLRALARGVVLACRAGLRAVWIRLLGYLGWLAVRAALAVGGVAALDLLGLSDRQWSDLLVAGVWVVINAVAYAALACLDAVLYLEIRTRTEGLDIMLARARRHGPPSVALLRMQP